MKLEEDLQEIRKRQIIYQIPAEGPHTTLGIQQGRKGPYTQGATFENGKFEERIDVTNHGRVDHPYPHYHDSTGLNSANSPARPTSRYDPANYK